MPRARHAVASLRSAAIASALACAAGCEDSARRFAISAPWPDGAVVVAAILGPSLEPLEPAPRLITGAGPVELELDEAPESITVRVRAYRTPDRGGPDFARCGLRFGGAAETVPSPMSAWSGTVDLGGGGRHAALAAEDPPSPLDLRFERSCAARGFCERLEPKVQSIDAQNLDPSSVVLLPSGRAVIAVRDDETGTPGGFLVRLEPDGTTARIDVPGLATDAPWDLALDPPDTIVGTSAGGMLFRLDGDGRLLASGRLPIRGPRLAIGADGTARAYGEGQVFELARGSTGSMPRTDLPANLRALAVVDRDNMAAISGDTLLVYDGVAWGYPYEGEELSVSVVLAADERIVAVAGDNGVVLRDQRGSGWSRLNLPYAAFGAKAALAAGEGRLILAASGGPISTWTGGEWCTAGKAIDQTLRALAAAPDRSTFIGITRRRATNREQVVRYRVLPE